MARRARGRALPTTRGTLQCGTGGAPVATANVPLSEVCASSLNVYVPTRKVSVQIGCSMSGTDVFVSVAGPMRWKLRAVDRSCTWIEYGPGGMRVIGVP